MSAGIRKALGTHAGHRLAVTLKRDAIRFQAIDAALEAVMATAGREPKLDSSVVDHCIAERFVVDDV